MRKALSNASYNMKVTIRMHGRQLQFVDPQKPFRRTLAAREKSDVPVSFLQGMNLPQYLAMIAVATMNSPQSPSVRPVILSRPSMCYSSFMQKHCFEQQYCIRYHHSNARLWQIQDQEPSVLRQTRAQAVDKEHLSGSQCKDWELRAGLGAKHDVFHPARLARLQRKRV